jgi:N-acetylneuraminate lyase
MDKIEGLVAAPFTPMEPSGGLLTERIPAYYDLLEKNGVAGAFINGSTGEGVSLTFAEKRRVAESWMKRARERQSLRIINLVGGTSYAECIDQARFSESIGTDAIAILGPYYFKPSNTGVLAEFVARIAESVPRMPVYYYHIPILTGVNLPMARFLREAAPMVPNLAGIKFTHEDFMDFMLCLRFQDGQYDMLWGRDENILSALVLGARGAVGSTYNYAAPLYLRLIRAFDEGDLATARDLQMASINLISLLGKYGGMATGKAYMKYIGFDCGPFRLPIKNLSDNDYQKFRADVGQLGMQEHFSVV